MVEATKQDEGKRPLGYLGFPALRALWEGTFPCYSHSIGNALGELLQWEIDRSHCRLVRAYQCFAQARGVDGLFRVLEHGAEKYGWDNWRSGQGLDTARLVHAFFRHVLACVQDGAVNAIDPEFGEAHLDHAFCCLHFLMSSRAYGLGTDDLWRKDTSDV